VLTSAVMLVIGLGLLWKSADLVVDGAVVFARRFKVSEIVIGLTLVSVGTSLPELVVNVVASLRGSADLAIANVLGSNVANILLILGLAGILGGILLLPLRSALLLLLGLRVLLFFHLDFRGPDRTGQGKDDCRGGETHPHRSLVHNSLHIRSRADKCRMPTYTSNPGPRPYRPSKIDLFGRFLR